VFSNYNKVEYFFGLRQTQKYFIYLFYFHFIMKTCLGQLTVIKLALQNSEQGVMQGK
jgi:hypothetical protein